MEPRGPRVADREREDREAASRRRRTGVRAGAVGLVLLFAAGIGVILSPANSLSLVIVMIVGIGLLLAAFFLVRTSVVDLLRTEGKKGR